MSKRSELRTGIAIIGSGNIGTDLMIKVLRTSKSLDVAAMVGIDPKSDGLARAARMGVATTADGVAGLLAMPEFDDVEMILDATSADGHVANWAVIEPTGRRVIDLTPAAIGPYCVPVVNLDACAAAPNVNMVSCGGQATIPIVAAIAAETRVQYAEIVASIASLSAGPGTRANIDEFTETTARGLECVGGAELAKAIIVLNPAEPPITMRDTVYCLIDPVRPELLAAAVERRVAEVQEYVPGYLLKQAVQVQEITEADPLFIPALDRKCSGMKVSVLLEVEGAAHYLPSYAGNLDIMTSAALRTAEHLAGSTSR